MYPADKVSNNKNLLGRRTCVGDGREGGEEGGERRGEGKERRGKSGGREGQERERDVTIYAT